jgi:prepilin signal peptidase PulO-like enzyme (type II secretory pathway)
LQIFFLSIVAAIYGVLLGNYVSSAYHRIPKAKPLNGLNDVIGKKPHCSLCLHPLKFYEYLPVLSWVFSRFKCNYCGFKIPLMYTILEASMMILSVLAFFVFDINIDYALICLVIAAILLNLSLFITYSKFYAKSGMILFISILLYGFYKYGYVIS